MTAGNIKHFHTGSSFVPLACNSTVTLQVAVTVNHARFEGELLFISKVPTRPRGQLGHRQARLPRSHNPLELLNPSRGPIQSDPIDPSESVIAWDHIWRGNSLATAASKINPSVPRMMAGPGGGPPRKSHTKSRKGCKTCKRRHIRCDENFPQWYVGSLTHCLRLLANRMEQPELHKAQLQMRLHGQSRPPRRSNKISQSTQPPLDAENWTWNRSLATYRHLSIPGAQHPILPALQ